MFGLGKGTNDPFSSSPEEFVTQILVYEFGRIDIEVGYAFESHRLLLVFLRVEDGFRNQICSSPFSITSGDKKCLYLNLFLWIIEREAF